MFPRPFMAILHLIIRANHTTRPGLRGTHTLNRTDRTQLLRRFSLHAKALSQRAAHGGQEARVGRYLLWYTVCVYMAVAVIMVVMQEACFLAGFHEEMAAFVVDKPVDHVLLAFGAAAAGAGESVRWG
jgi:hypothetical protein